MPATVEFGFALSSEEHLPSGLVRQAVAAEEAGFAFIGVWPRELRPALAERGLALAG